MWHPAVPAQQLFELFARDAREYRRIRDLVAVQMENRQHDAVADRIEELVGVPCRRERTRLGFPIADDAGHDEIWIVEHRAGGVAQGVPELASFVNAARRFRRHMARNAAR